MTTNTAAAWRELAARDTVLLDGFHALKHALRFGAEVPLAVAEDRAAALDLARDLAPDLHPRLAELLTPVPPRDLAALVPRPHPTGVAALARPAPRPPVPGRGPVVVLENPRHLGNIGAVIRLAAGAGAAGVITTGTADPWHPAVLRAAAGLHYATAVDRAGGLDTLPPGPLYGLDPAGTDIRSVPVPDGALLAFGSERPGLSPALKERATGLVALPMREGVSSYNLATSVAMALFHWLSRPG
ncbi:TrmH family RNA methyltransferase [Streptomyces johnsoniae]|uniref:TrmH family RNA methyltransferase n=1 Tax=Streptomyces johnsoniae TaxID=3075532 RepID=A0ABU2SAQ4_9ACTN|nr:TrmH family RNA methyltransferase [Streptomyces sp. DSM 41886]MDT0446046.1 TrmH family RNA methyltransferase [Streptomyces sp. DSM 41886]